MKDNCNAADCYPKLKDNLEMGKIYKDDVRRNILPSLPRVVSVTVPANEKRIPGSPPPVRPCPRQDDSPIWSVMIPAFNCSAYLAKTLISVLNQDPGPDIMQIAVVDDASTDANVEELVGRIGLGRVEYIKQLVNVGSLHNFNTCIDHARGRFVHILHGDDLVLPEFYSTLERLFLENPEAGACFTRYRVINEEGEYAGWAPPWAEDEGILEDWLESIASKQLIQYVGIAVRREVYEKLGGFFGVTYGEDWEMWARIASHFPVAYSPETLAEYRMHENSISGNKFLTGQNIYDLLWVMKRIQQYLPDECKTRVWNESATYYSESGLSIANNLWREHGNKRAAHLQLLAVLHLRKDLGTLREIAKLYFAMLTNRRKT